MMALNPSLRSMVAAAAAKYQPDVADDETACQIVETLKDAARLAGLADPSRREEFACAAAYVDGFILGEADEHDVADTE